MRVRTWAAAAVACVALAGPACGRGGGEAGGPAIAQLTVREPPQTLLGLEVRKENVASALKQFRPSYVDAAGLYSLRRGDGLVQATLQVARFRDDARYRSNGFRLQVINLIGGAAPRATRVEATTVYRTKATQQTVAVWFRGAIMYQLSVRDDFGKPRALVRALLELRT